MRGESSRTTPDIECPLLYPDPGGIGEYRTQGLGIATHEPGVSIRRNLERHGPRVVRRCYADEGSPAIADVTTQ